MIKKIFFILLLILPFAYAINPPSNVANDIPVVTNDTIVIKWGNGGNPAGTLYQVEEAFDESYEERIQHDFLEEFEHSFFVGPNQKRCFRVRAKDQFTGEISEWTFINNGQCVTTFANPPKNLQLSQSNNVCPDRACVSSPYIQESRDGRCGLINNTTYYCKLGSVCDVSQGVPGRCTDFQQFLGCNVYNSCSSARNLIPNLPYASTCSSQNTYQVYKIKTTSHCNIQWTLASTSDFMLYSYWIDAECGGSSHCQGFPTLNTYTCSYPERLPPGTYYAAVEKIRETGLLSKGYTITPIVTNCAL